MTPPTITAQALQPRIWIAFDIDGTLQNPDGTPRTDIITILKNHLPYAHIIVWSGGGTAYARQKGRDLKLPPGITYTSKTRPNHPIHITYDDQDITLGTVNIRV